MVLGESGPMGTDLRVWNVECAFAASVLVSGCRSRQSANPPRVVALRNSGHYSLGIKYSTSILTFRRRRRGLDNDGPIMSA